MSTEAPGRHAGRSCHPRQTGRRPARDIARRPSRDAGRVIGGLARAAGRRGRALVLAAIAVAPLACSGPVSSPSPPLPAAAAGPLLAVLDVTPDRATIAAYPADGAPRSVPAPPGELQWLAADARGRLVATRMDGAVVRTVVPAAAPTAVVGPTAAAGSTTADVPWADVPFVGRPGGPPLSFAVPDAAGDRFVALSAAYGSGAASFLAIADRPPAVGLGIEANGAAPAWLDDRRVVVAGLGSLGAPATVVVDTRTGRRSAGPAGFRAATVSADGARVATVGADERTVEVWVSGAWAARGALAGPRARVPAEPSGEVTALALDGSGRSLAVVWTGPDLLPAVVVRYEDAGGWRERGRITLRTGTVRAAVAWGPAPVGAPR